MGILRIEDGVTLADPMPPAGQAILDALAAVAFTLPYDLTVTSGTDGAHSGLDDPHHKGLAYDVRSHGLPDKNPVLEAVMARLGTPDEVPTAKDGGLVTRYFFGWLEALNQRNEHFHFQLRHGVEYRPFPHS